MDRSFVACRLSSYGRFQHLALEHLASLGVRFVELQVPAPEKAEEVLSQLARHGLRASTLHGEIDLTRTDAAAAFERQLAIIEKFGTKLLFLPVKTMGVPLETAYARLRDAGEAAARRGVTIALETHPDLVTNADVALATMAGVNHPAVRINFDTANIYFYNHNVNGVVELARLIRHVAAVHLKETNGAYRAWHFPALGRGVVEFRGTLDLLDRAGYRGPLTLEIEGVEGEDAGERLVCDRIAESLGFLRALGKLP